MKASVPFFSLLALVTYCATVRSIGVTNPAEIVHVALGYGKLRIVAVDNSGLIVGGMNREYFVTSPGEHTIEVQMFGYYQSTSNAKVKIKARAGDFVLLCPLKEISPFAKTGKWGILALVRASQTVLATTEWRADGYEDYTVQCDPWVSVVEEQDAHPLAPGKENYWKTTKAARDFRDQDGLSVVDLAKRLQKPNRAAQLAEAGY